MTDTGRFDKIDPADPESTVGGVVTPNYVDPAPYEGKVRVQELGAQETEPEAGGHVFTVQDYRVDVPVGSFRPEVGMVYTHLTSAGDPFLEGRTGRVTALLHKSHATAYRLRVSFEEA
jgi:hypothetical protein